MIQSLPAAAPPISWTSTPVSGLTGTALVPGDAAIATRALVLAALAVGESVVTGVPEGLAPLADVLCMLGAQVAPREAGVWRVHGVGVGGLRAPVGLVDVGDNALAFALLAGLLSTQGRDAFLVGGGPGSAAFLKTALAPLGRMGAAFISNGGGPLLVRGTGGPVPIDFRPRTPVPCDVKSALVLAALNTAGRTTVVEDKPTADHTERLLRHFGAAIAVQSQADDVRSVSVTGEHELKPARVDVAGDVTLAAAALVAATLAVAIGRPGGADLVLRGAGMNDHRAAPLRLLRDMGLDLAAEGIREQAGEPVADLRLRPAATPLRGIATVGAQLGAGELALLAVAALGADGVTSVRGLSSGLAGTLAAALSACGGAVEGGLDFLTVTGGRPVPGGATVRVPAAMAPAFLALGTATAAPVTVVVSDGRFPVEAARLLNALGGACQPGPGGVGHGPDSTR
ncbi:MAG: 3-phosphoshikimate 1-carboxyvinyltransferase [Azospirillaceae bacterium]|nr:3-phosphoshikimate 1-carboxyvinyltransferase [Azospirillaceae bacterium]